MEGKIVDLSAGGLSFFSELPIGLCLKVSNVINIQFALDEITFEATASIVRLQPIESIMQKNMVYIAAEFIEMENKGTKFIRKYIQTQKNERGERLLERIDTNLNLTFTTLLKSGSMSPQIRTGIGKTINLQQF